MKNFFKKIGIFPSLVILLLTFGIIYFLVLGYFKVSREPQETIIENNSSLINLAFEEIKAIQKEKLLAKYKGLLKYADDKDRLLKDLELIPGFYHSKVLSLCWTESHLRYNISHPWNDSTTGICGIKSSFWTDYVTKHNVEVNSLYAGYLVLKYLEEKNNGDFYRAVKMYKGAKTNLASTNKVMSIYNKFR